MKTHIPGVTIDHDEKREAAGQRSWILHLCIPTIVPGEYKRRSKFFYTEAERDAALAEDGPRVLASRAGVEAEKAAYKTLNLPPPLPQAPGDTELFETLALHWLETKVKPRLKASTYKGYKSALTTHLLPHMRSWPVTAAVMTVEQLTRVLGPVLRAEEVSLSMRMNCQLVLSAFFRWVLKDKRRLLTFNPARDLAADIRQDDEKHIELNKIPNPMTRDQLETFLDWQQEHYPDLYPLFLWLGYQGSRIAEACALQWEHVFFEDEKAHIAQTFSAAQRAQEIEAERASGRKGQVGKGLQPTKTCQNDQYIDLHPRVIDELLALQRKNKEAWLARGRYGPEPTFVFLNTFGEPLRPSVRITNAFKEGCAALGLLGQTPPRNRAFKIHSLRATFITLSLMEGQPIGWVVLMVGHTSEKTIYKSYYRWIRLKAGNQFRRGAHGLPATTSRG